MSIIVVSRPRSLEVAKCCFYRRPYQGIVPLEQHKRPSSQRLPYEAAAGAWHLLQTASWKSVGLTNGPNRERKGAPGTTIARQRSRERIYHSLRICPITIFLAS